MLKNTHGAAESRADMQTGKTVPGQNSDLVIKMVDSVVRMSQADTLKQFHIDYSHQALIAQGGSIIFTIHPFHHPSIDSSTRPSTSQQSNTQSSFSTFSRPDSKFKMTVINFFWFITATPQLWYKQTFFFVQLQLPISARNILHQEECPDVCPGLRWYTATPTSNVWRGLNEQLGIICAFRVFVVVIMYQSGPVVTSQ